MKRSAKLLIDSIVSCKVSFPYRSSESADVIGHFFESRINVIIGCWGSCIVSRSMELLISLIIKIYIHITIIFSNLP